MSATFDQLYSLNGFDSSKAYESGLNQILHQLPAGIAIVNGPDHVFTFINHTYETMFGRTSAELLGKSVRAVWPEVSDQGVYEIFDEVYKTGEAFRASRFFVQFTYHAKQREGYYDFIMQPILNDRNEVTDILIHVIDVTEIALREEKLKHNEHQQERTLAQLESLLRNAPVGFAFFDREYRYLRINETLAEINGLSVEAHIGRTIEEVLPVTAPFVLPIVEKVFQTGEPLFDWEVKGETSKAPGKERCWITGWYPVFNDRTNEIDTVGVTVIEITDRKQAEQKVIQSEKRYKALTDAASSILWTTDAQGAFITQQPAWEKYTGQVWKDSEGYDYTKAAHPDDLERLMGLWLGAVTNKTPYYSEGRLWHAASGQYRYFESKAVPIYNDQNEVVEWVGMTTDVHDRKLAEAALQESENRFRSLSETLPQMIWLMDVNGNPLYYSRHWKEYTGGLSGLEGWEFMIHPDDKFPSEELFRQSLQSGKPFRAELRLRNKDGKYRWHQSIAEPVKDIQGTITQWTGALIDIQQQKDVTAELELLVEKRTEELRQKNEDLRRSNEDLQQFAHVASHDLKEPVRKIMFYSQRLLDENKNLLPVKALNHLQKIEGAAERMYKMVEGVLAYSTLAYEQQPISEVSIEKIVNNVMTDLEILIREKSASFRIGLLPVIKGSEVLIYQLFYNLIVNAIKFSLPDKHPVISIDSETRDNQMVIRIADNGIGFDNQFSQTIFSTFTRLHSKDRYEGTGLGLSLCRKIMLRHQGSIEAESKPGVGSTFILRFPIEQMTF